MVRMIWFIQYGLYCMHNTILSWSSLLLLVVVMTLIAIFKIKKWTKKVFREDDEEDNYELESSSNKIAVL